MASAFAQEAGMAAKEDEAPPRASSSSALPVVREPWRGVSVGGWLLLEPGTAHELFDKYRDIKGKKLQCEWDLTKAMRKAKGLDELTNHRKTFVTRRDFERIKEMGLNAVRVPFGYWIVLGSTGRDPYMGPALEFLDQAVQWAEECGLEILLDLHGAPGGESGGKPCGREQPAGRWIWQHWRVNTSLRALRVLAERYQHSPAVTGIAVCNEPSSKIPLDVLCSFYKRALDTIRKAGMSADRVTVVLPVFQRSLTGFVEAWDDLMGENARTGISFEVHWYHCFENEWHGRTFAQHLRTVQEHTQELQRFPVVVGEWSLALGCGAYHGKYSKEQMRFLFACAQLAAYREASHGWFFWNWQDHCGIDWDWQRAHEEGFLPCNSELLQLPELPPGEDANSDPLEALFDAPPSDPRIRLGDTIYLRTFHGRYLDVEGPQVRARYSDRGKWQQFVLCPFGQPASHAESDGLCDGDIVSLLAHNNRYLGVKSTQVSASWTDVEEACAFVVRTQGTEEVRHRSPVFLQSCRTSRVLAPNESDPKARDKLLARWKDFGSWQRIVIEKPLSTAVTPHRPRRRSSFPGQMSPALCGTPMQKLRHSVGNTPTTRRRTSTGQTSTARRHSIIGLTPHTENIKRHCPQQSSRRRRSSIGSAPSAAGSPPKRTLKRRSSIDDTTVTPARNTACSNLVSPQQEESAQPEVEEEQCMLVTTPTRKLRRLSSDVDSQLAQTAQAPETPCGDATTPTRKQRRSAVDPEILSVATPNRRRRSKCREGPCSPKVLHDEFKMM